MFDTAGMLLDPPAPVTPRNWYCDQRPGGLVELHDNHLAYWTVATLHARYLATRPRRIGGRPEHLRAFLVDLDGGLLLPSLEWVMLYHEPGGWWHLKLATQPYVDSLALHELPVEPPGDLIGECCRYTAEGRGAEIAPCEVRGRMG